MQPRLARSTAVAAVLAGLVPLSGCGVADGPSARPGAAVHVGDSTLSMGTLDSIVSDYCTVMARSGQPPTPTASFRTLVAVVWSQAEAMRVLAREYDIAVPQGQPTRAQVEALVGPDAVTSGNEDSLRWIARQQALLEQPLLDLGRKVADQQSLGEIGDDQARSLGSKALTDWLEKNDLELNPALGRYDPEDQEDQFRTNDLSLPVSDEATSTDSTKKLVDDVAALPPEQRCGAAPSAAPAAG